MSFVYDENAVRGYGAVSRPSFSLTAPLKRLGKQMRRALYATTGQVAMDRQKIHYDILMQDAMRGIVRKVLQEAADFGLPGDHHFFITFHTNAPGVQVSERLKAKYPEEMTIVVQHQFWDLEADDFSFSVGLSFGGVPETLKVPYAALKSFFDPSVSFGLRFTEAADELDNSLAQKDAIEKIEEGMRNEKARIEPKVESAKKSDPKSGADVVSLDAFRKKDGE